MKNVKRLSLVEHLVVAAMELGGLESAVANRLDLGEARAAFWPT